MKSVNRSAQFKKLRLKHCMNWEERDAAALQRSLIYRTISALSPRIVFWICIIVLSIILVVRMPA